MGRAGYFSFIKGFTPWFYDDMVDVLVVDLTFMPSACNSAGVAEVDGL